ncbi:hypothetical protein GCK32_015961, partial [Trichostrongylus colubriformis]
MIPKDTNIHDENSTLSENAGAGTIVSSYEKEVFAEKNEQLSVDGKDIKVIGSRRISDDHMTIYAKSKFGRYLKSSKLQITASKTAPAPVFRSAIYALNVSDTMPVNTTIHDFGMSVPADCHLAIATGDSEKVFVEADFENAVVSRHLNTTVVFAGTPTELDLSALASGTKSQCASKESELLEISPDCHITVKQPIDMVVEALINGNSTEIKINTLQVSEELEQSALQVVLYAAPGGVANFFTELQRSYSDLTFYPLAIEIVDALHRNTLSLAVVDRNRRVIAVDDSRDILRSFFQKDDFPHALLQSMKTSLCDDVICSNGGRCRQLIELKNSSISFYGSESIWSVPNGVARTRCECASGYVGEYCEQVNRCDNVICPDGRCSTSGNCTSDCEVTCK